MGQWLSPDPILASYMQGGPNGGVYYPINLGLYSYCYNSPIVYRDPNGKNPVLVAAGVAVGIDFLIQSGEIAFGDRTNYDMGSLVTSAFFGSVGGAASRAISKKVGNWAIREGATFASDMAVSSWSRWTRGEEVTFWGAVFDAGAGLVGGRLAGSGARGAAASSNTGQKLAQKAEAFADAARKGGLGGGSRSQQMRARSLADKADAAAGRLGEHLGDAEMNGGVVGSNAAQELGDAFSGDPAGDVGSGVQIGQPPAGAEGAPGTAAPRHSPEWLRYAE